MFYLLKKKMILFHPCQGHFFTLALTSALQPRHLTLVFLNHQVQNRITIQPKGLLHHFEKITFMNL